MEVTLWSRDSAAVKEINGGLAEVGRMINLHVRPVSQKKIFEVAIVIHGRST